MTSRTRSWPEAVAVAVVAFLALAVLTGWVWSVVAHSPEYTVYRRNFAYYSSEAEFGHAFEMDLTFAWISAVAGLAGGLLLGWRYWSLGWAVAGLGAVAAGGAAVLAWRLGVVLGPDSVRASAAAARPGDTFSGPLVLGTRSVLLTLPLTTLLGVMVSVWLRAPRDELRSWRVDSV